ncbi:MAG TPA: diphosphate--fructose-6-phosphate 1-phosphotransferase [Acidobacteriota bacterium]|nr:diphosphate--fructose-6-phosphate 1-phosphotransferase [Acidobacteriota bacterium]
MLKGNAIIGQSGGPTSVINASLAGVVEACKSFAGVKKILGMRYGIQGFMEEDIIDLGKQPPRVLAGLKSTPSSALGSCRYKLQQPDLPRIVELLRKYDIRYVFLIGGNDTMDTIHRLEACAKEDGYELIGNGIPKTVDNDLYGTDHTPGFPSAARYVALSVKQAGVLARDMRRVDQFVVHQTVGRGAGWLAAASVAAKRDPDDAPHILCLPERPFEKEKFLADVKRCYDKLGWVSIVCGEGVAYADGTPVSASRIKDKFSNIEFGAMGGTSAAMMLHRMICDEFGFRGEFQVPESLPMCAADRAVKLDIAEAHKCGKKAVELAAEGKTGLMVSLVRKPGPKYSCTTGTANLAEVAVKAKPMPGEFINSEGNFTTDAFLKYIRPLVGSMPEYARLASKKAAL